MRMHEPARSQIWPGRRLAPIDCESRELVVRVGEAAVAADRGDTEVVCGTGAPSGQRQKSAFPGNRSDCSAKVVPADQVGGR